MSELLINTLAEMTTNAAELVKPLLSAIILLFIGLVVGKIASKIIEEVLIRIRLDYYITEKEKPPFSFTLLIAIITKWWIYLSFIAAAVSILPIESLQLYVDQYIAFVPRIVGASIIITGSYILGEYIRHHIRQANRLYAELTGKVLLFFIMYVALALALPILGVNATLVANIMLVIIGSIGIGIALALGLGLKEAVAEISKKYVRKLNV